MPGEVPEHQPLADDDDNNPFPGEVYGGVVTPRPVPTGFAIPFGKRPTPVINSGKVL